MVKAIEVDPCVPEICDDILFPQAKHARFPQLPVKSPLSQKVQRLQEKPIFAQTTQPNRSKTKTKTKVFVWLLSTLNWKPL